MKTLLRLALLIAVGPVTAAKADDAPATATATAPKGDLARFQGTWKSMLGPEKNIAATLKFQDSKVTVSATSPDGEAFEIKGQIKLGETAKPFKTLDWVKFVGPEGNDLPETLALYEIEDADTIRVCNGGPGRDRPTAFKAGEGEFPTIIVLKREKN